MSSFSPRFSLRRLACLAAAALSAVGAAGCSPERATEPHRALPPLPLPAAPADSGAIALDSGGARPASATLSWNALTRTLVERNQPNQQAALRAFAYVTLAARGAVVAADSAFAGGGTTARGRQALARVALSTAAAVVLTELFPRDAVLIEQHRAELVDAGLTSAAVDRRAAAERLGAAVGRAVVERARTDRFDLAWDGTVPTGDGVWASAIVPARPPLLPRLGEARTFFLARGDQFRPAPPPAPGTPAFQAALAEVRRVSDTRTAEQRRVAEAWAMTTGSLAAGYWNAVADSLIARDRLNEGEAARVLALTNMAAWDANVACHDAKYTYWLARPTQMDPRITLPIALPNHPSYPSNHACLSGTAAEVLASRFPGDAAALRARAAEAMLSRVYAGLHYRFDGEAGLGIARQVAALAAARDAALRGRFPVR